MEELDRVLDRDDVLLHRPVHVVDHRRERGRLARAGRAGEQDDAALLLRQPADDGRQVELVDRLDVDRDGAHHERDEALLAEGVDAEAAEALERVGEVDLVLGLELGELVRVAEHLQQDALGVVRRQALRAHDRLELAVEADERIGGHLEVEVGALGRDQVAEGVVEIEGHRSLSSTRRAGRLRDPRAGGPARRVPLNPGGARPISQPKHGPHEESRSTPVTEDHVPIQQPAARPPPRRRLRGPRARARPHGVRGPQRARQARRQREADVRPRRAGPAASRRHQRGLPVDAIPGRQPPLRGGRRPGGAGRDRRGDRGLDEGGRREPRRAPAADREPGGEEDAGRVRGGVRASSAARSTRPWTSRARRRSTRSRSATARAPPTSRGSSPCSRAST